MHNCEIPQLLVLIQNYNQVIDQSDSYKNHKDLNNLLCYERER
jgi:hypothetical protein